MLPPGSTNLSDNFFHQGIRIIIFGTAAIAIWLGVDPMVVVVIILIEFIALILILQYNKVVYFEGYLLIRKNFKREKVIIDDIETIEIGGWPLYLVQVKFKKPTAIGQDLIFCADQKLLIGIRDDAEKILTRIKEHVYHKEPIIKQTQPTSVSEEKPDELDVQIKRSTGIDGRLISNVLIGLFLLLILYAVYSMIRG